MNLALARHLAWRSLRRHPTVSLATVLGVTLGMMVIAAILVVDANSTEQPVFSAHPVQLDAPGGDGRAVVKVWFERGADARRPMPSIVPTQEGSARQGLSSQNPASRRGEDDYQAMRLAVRLASLLAFAVGAVIVFYTMRFSVASRARELSLLLCLGEARKNLALSLVLEAGLFGILGTLLGLAAAFPAAKGLLMAGISTTGRYPSATMTVPGLELAFLALISVSVALLGVVGPIRSLYRMRIVDILQPRFLSPDAEPETLQTRGFAWLLPVLAAGGWLAVRPFLQDWLDVVQFFLVEIVFVGVLTMVTLWWVRPLLQGAIWLMERLLQPFLPLDSLLVGRRLHLSSHKLVFTIAAVTLVFSLLTALHDITRALKYEIHHWAAEAMYPYAYFQRGFPVPAILKAVHEGAAKRGIQVFRLSRKARGEFPVRLVAAEDINPVREAAGLPPLVPGTVIFSRTLAARFDVTAGDRLVVAAGEATHRFRIIEVSDGFGYFAEDGQYVDLKSYALFADGNTLFAGNLEQSLGEFAMARRADGRPMTSRDLASLRAYYRYLRGGPSMANWQKREIDRDFLIFDFVLFMTIGLAAVGVANSILIQVHARRREFSVLRTLGISRRQTARLLLVEGAVIGAVGALLALFLGNVAGLISVSFLDRFTLFDYRFVFSLPASMAISLLAVLTCMAAALYPATVANKVSSAESLHYE